jgi:hypothetical protein
MIFLIGAAIIILLGLLGAVIGISKVREYQKGAE